MSGKVQKKLDKNSNGRKNRFRKLLNKILLFLGLVLALKGLKGWIKAKKQEIL